MSSKINLVWDDNTHVTVFFIPDPERFLVAVEWLAKLSWLTSEVALVPLLSNLAPIPVLPGGESKLCLVVVVLCMMVVVPQFSVFLENKQRVL